LATQCAVAAERARLYEAEKNARQEAERSSRERDLVVQQLAASERKFAAMFARAPFAIALVKVPSLAVADVNPAFERLFGFPREEIVGKTSVDAGMHRDVRGREALRAEFVRRGYVRGMEKTVFTKVGSASSFQTISTRWRSTASRSCSAPTRTSRPGATARPPCARARNGFGRWRTTRRS